jgi:hypothetical protein
MTIKVNDQKIKFGDYTMTFVDDGFEFDGKIIAKDFDELGPPLSGTVSGYTTGGVKSPPSPTYSNVIDKFPFAVDSNATDVGDLTFAKRGMVGQSSSIDGFATGGFNNGEWSFIEKFPFASDTNASIIGNLTAARERGAGQSSSSFGYTSGGRPSTTPSPLDLTIIDKFSFAADANATDVGDLTQGRESVAGQSSTTFGYTSGGLIPSSQVDTIDKFPFATDVNATNVGNLTRPLGRASAITGQSSTTFGYSSGGFYNIIDKFPFAADANATDVGDLTVLRARLTGQSSTVSGYNSGGGPPANNTIDKFPFSSDTNATDVGDLTQGRYANSGGQQD